jgi:hypothetical protein
MLFSAGKEMCGTGGDAILGSDCRLSSEMIETGGFVVAIPAISVAKIARLSYH